jgi:hypothetical protein
MGAAEGGNVERRSDSWDGFMSSKGSSSRAEYFHLPVDTWLPNASQEMASGTCSKGSGGSSWALSTRGVKAWDPHVDEFGMIA